MNQKRSLFTLRNFASKHPGAFTEPSLRWLAFNRDHNGFADAFIKVGRRIFVDENRFFDAIDGQNRANSDFEAAL